MQTEVQIITMNIVFYTKSKDARKEMLKNKKLTLEMAIEELGTCKETFDEDFF